MMGCLFLGYDLSRTQFEATKSMRFCDNHKRCVQHQTNVDVFEEIRQNEKIYTEPIPPGELSFKVMNYNVLAQDLISGHPYLYFDHKKKDLEWNNRKPLLIKEIISVNPDILTMQEVQESHVSSFYNKLEFYGYKGIFKKKTGNATDGCAIYYKTSVFDLVDWTSVEYDQPGVKCLNKSNIGMILRLKFKFGPNEVVVANTHLLYNPKKWDIRLAQTQLLLAELHRMALMCENSPPAIILVGDLNSRPDSQIVQLLSKGYVNINKQLLPPSLGILDNCTHVGESKLYNRDKYDKKQRVPKKKSNETHEQQMLSAILEIDPIDESVPIEANSLVSAIEHLKKIQFDESPKHKHTIKHGFNFSSVYKINGNGINDAATTYHNKWVIVDYIFYSNLRMLSRIRLPTVEECTKFVGRIPNDKLPSDHFPLIASFSTV